MEIQVQAISKHYGQKLVLSNYSATFPIGQTSCIMGESGCGKTTLLRILMGLERMDAGTVVGLEGLRRAAVFQENRLCENLSASSNIKLVCGGQYQKRQYVDAFAAVGLDCLDKPVRELSGGMKRRVAILRAVLSRPDVIFLDEPFRGLDDATYEQVVEYVRRETLDRTVILVSHDRRDADRMGARVYLLEKV